MTQTAALIAFLAARLDEDEERAWAVHDVSKCDAMLYEENMAAWAEGAKDCDCGYPGRVLREVAAKRAILASLKSGQSRYASGEDLGLEIAVEHLVAVYSGHPDYRPEWKP